MRLDIIKNGKSTNVTGITGSLNLSTSVDTLGASFTFNIARHYYDPSLVFADTIEPGDIVILTNEKELFRGVVITINTSKFSKTIECLDYCFYLNKNKIINLSGSDVKVWTTFLF